MPREAPRHLVENFRRGFPRTLVALLRVDQAAHRHDEPFGVWHADPACLLGYLPGQLCGGLETAAQYGQHRVPGKSHHRGLRVTGRGGGPLEGGQRHLGLVYPGQLRQRDETPEQAVALTDAVARGPPEPDQLRGRVQPVLGTRWIPQCVQAGVEHVSQGRNIAGTAGQHQRLVCQ